MNLINRDEIGKFISEAMTHYEKSCPQLCEYLDDVYIRMNDFKTVTLEEIDFVGSLKPRGDDGYFWLTMEYAQNNFHHYAHRTGIAERFEWIPSY